MPDYDESDLPIDPFSDEEMDALENPKMEVDPSAVAFLDQETAAFQEGRAEFIRTYGFDHDCTCDTDYTDGKVGVVTECFMKLTSQALTRSAQATHEIRVYSGMLDQLLRINNDLIQMLAELGHEKELQEYFTKEPSDVDTPIESEIEDGPSDAEEDDEGDGENEFAGLA